MDCTWFSKIFSIADLVDGRNIDGSKMNEFANVSTTTKMPVARGITVIRILNDHIGFLSNVLKHHSPYFEYVI